MVLGLSGLGQAWRVAAQLWGLPAIVGESVLSLAGLVWMALLLSYLLHHKGKVVSRTELIEHIYDQDFDRDSNTIEVFVTRIRKKLGPDVITTIRGLGYSLDEPAGPGRG